MEKSGDFTLHPIGYFFVFHQFIAVSVKFIACFAIHRLYCIVKTFLGDSCKVYSLLECLLDREFGSRDRATFDIF